MRLGHSFTVWLPPFAGAVFNCSVRCGHDLDQRLGEPSVTATPVAPDGLMSTHLVLGWTVAVDVAASNSEMAVQAC